MQMGWGESCADRTHDEKEREEGKEPFWVLSKKCTKKGNNTCCPLSRRLAGKTKGEEVRIQMQCRRVEGQLWHL
jgi:hypothetical protein